MEPIYRALALASARRPMALGVVLLLGGCSLSGVDIDEASVASASSHYEPVALEEPAQGLQLHAGPFELGPGEELYYCRITTLPIAEPMDVIRLHHRASAVHHFNVWGLSSGPEGDREGACEDLWAETTMGLAAPLYASQDREFVGQFPDGVAGRLVPEQQVLLEFHSLNTTDAPVVAEAFLNVEWAEPGTIEVHANGLFGSNTDLELPPNQQVTVSKKCLVDVDMHVFALGSHFHRSGLQFDILLLDEAGEPDELVYTNTSWESAEVVMLSDNPIVLRAGGGFEYRCTFHNRTDSTIGYGPSVDDEMCMMAAVYYPDAGFKVCASPP